MQSGFGYPFCHQGDIPDPIYGKYARCNDFVPPDVKLGPHVASLGMRFYTGEMFPADYKNNIIIAEHGSWNRTKKSGYNLTRVVLNAEGTHVVKTEPFMTCILNGNDLWRRPVDVQVMPDGLCSSPTIGTARSIASATKSHERDGTSQLRCAIGDELGLSGPWHTMPWLDGRRPRQCARPVTVRRAGRSRRPCLR